jgi:hypothetical protein
MHVVYMCLYACADMCVCMMKNYSTFKREILPFAKMWLHLEEIMLRETGQSWKQKY